MEEQSDRSSFVLKSLMCARLLQAITYLCPHFKECCCINQSDCWDKMCSDFTATSTELWQNWVDDIIEKLVTVSKDVMKHTDVSNTLSLLLVSSTLKLSRDALNVPLFYSFNFLYRVKLHRFRSTRKKSKITQACCSRGGRLSTYRNKPKKRCSSHK